MYASIVAGTDGSATSRTAVEHAASLAKLTGATLHLVHAYRRPSTIAMAAPEVATYAVVADQDVEEAARTLVDGLADELRRRGVEQVQAHARGVPAAEALCAVAGDEGADLIVVGNRGMKGARRVLGSVPNTVAHRAECAVLIVTTS